MSSRDSGGWRFREDAPANVAYYDQVRSPLKFYVLDFVNRRGTATYSELAEETGMPTHYAADRLTRYARNGLLSRSRRGDGGLSIFELTDTGHTRLEYFREIAGPR